MSFVFSNPSTGLLDIEALDANIIECEHITCSVCKYNGYMSDDINYDPNVPTYDCVTTSCCLSILCPKCFVVDTSKGIITTNHLYINSVIYLQDEENLDLERFDDCIKGNSYVQYNWCLFKPIDNKLLDNYSVINKNYNSYDNPKKDYDDDKEIDYAFMHALCECKTCDFKCTAEIYMDS